MPRKIVTAPMPTLQTRSSRRSRCRIAPTSRAAILLAMAIGFLSNAATAVESTPGSVTPPPSPSRVAPDPTANTNGPSTNLVTALTVQDYLQLVLERNESLHARILEYEISQKRFQAEQGIFEPELSLSYDRVENERENTAEQRRSSGVLIFKEKNDVYNAGLEALVPTGARVRLGYSLRDLRNNLQDPTAGSIVTNLARGEYSTFAGVSVTQPLLKNAWLPANLANIRLAALASDVAYQEYRRQMMIVISTAEASYWNLYLSQEQVRFFEESAHVAEALVNDNKARFQAGQAAELEILEAQAGLALRQSKLAEARQKYFETAAQLLTLASLASPGSGRLIRALDQPSTDTAPPAFLDSGRQALDLNPDYLAQLKKVKQEEIRVAYSANQRLPQLDLKASYGLNGLGPSPGSSWDDIERQDFPSFSAGVELRIPLLGNTKGRREHEAARLRKQQALVTLKDTETQVLNAVDTAVRKVASALDSTRNYEQVVNFSENLLKTEMARLESGKVSSRRVLEVEASNFEARNSVVEARVGYERARLELELVQGTLLKSRHLDLSQSELDLRTTSLLRDLGVSEGHLAAFRNDLREAYRHNRSSARSASDRSDAASASAPAPTESPERQAVRVLRQTLQQPTVNPGSTSPAPAPAP